MGKMNMAENKRHRGTASKAVPSQYAGRALWGFPAVLSYATVLALAAKQTFQKTEGNWLALLFGSFSVDPAIHLALFAALCWTYRWALTYTATVPWSRRDKLCVTLPAGFFAAAMVFGRSFADTASWNLVFGNSLQFAKSLIVWNGYFILFSIAIAALFTWLPTARLWRGRNAEPFVPGLWGRYQRALSAHPFRTAFFTLLIAHLPVLILSYPGIFMGDTGVMILQSYNIPEWTSNQLLLIDDTFLLNNANPVSYTLFLRVCLDVGKGVFGSYNAGLFLASSLQSLAQITVIAAVLAQMVRLGLRFWPLVGLSAYFALAPRVQNYGPLFSKETLAACALLLFLLSLFRLLTGEGIERKNMLWCVLSGVGVSLLRNEGRYILLVSLALLLVLLPKLRRRLAVPALCLLVVTTLFFQILLPAAHITPGSKREALSVPFQQTARYLRDYPEDVTAEERSAIGAILDVDSIGEHYTPELSDAVKKTYKESATAAERGAYFKAWFKMGLRHPDVYLQATMNNYYNYVYPGEKLTGVYTYSWSETCMDKYANQPANKSGLSLELHHPDQLNVARDTYESLRENLFKMPLLSLVNSAAIYVWGLILLAVYHIKRRNRQALALTIPLVAFVLFYLFGPVNGQYFRYLYGVSVALPVVFFLSLYLEQIKEGGKTA